VRRSGSARPHRAEHAPQTNASSRPEPRPRSRRRGDTSREGAFSVEIRQVHGDAAMEGVPERVRQVRGGVSTPLRTPGVLVPFGHSAPLDTTRSGRGRQNSQNTARPQTNTSSRPESRPPSGRRGETPTEAAGSAAPGTPMEVSRPHVAPLDMTNERAGEACPQEQSTLLRTPRHVDQSLNPDRGGVEKRADPHPEKIPAVSSCAGSEIPRSGPRVPAAGRRSAPCRVKRCG